jgi:hypothetical protein
MLKQSRTWTLVMAAILLFLGSVSAQQFVELSQALGVAHTPQHFNLFGAGTSMVDFNQDGIDDLSYHRHQQLPSFFLSDEENFSSIASFANASSSPKAMQWVDVDNDGDLDCFISRRAEALALYERTGPNSFIDRIAPSGIINNNHHSYGASWGDYDLDGDLDLYLCAYDAGMNFANQQDNNHLYRNNGNFTFEDVTVSAGLQPEYALSFQSLWLDVNHDLYPDLLVINDKDKQNRLYLNNGDGTFDDISESSGMNTIMDAMTTTCADFNQDGYLDVFITNSNVTNNATLGTQLFAGGPNNTFTEVSAQHGLNLTDVFTWGANWMDIDNDGDLDLYIAEAKPLDPDLDDHLFVNLGAESGFQFIENNALIEGAINVDSFSISSGDPNNDGYVDFCVSTNIGDPLRYFVNQGGENHYLKVKLAGVASNSMGVGAWITCYSGGMGQSIYTFCGENYLGQNSYTKIFGLAGDEKADSLIVEWPSGVIDRLYDVSTDQTIELLEGASFELAILEGEAVYHLCEGDSLELQFEHPNFVGWSNGEESSTLVITQSGEYWANYLNPVNEQLSTNSISINFSETQTPEINISHPDCFGGAGGMISLDLFEGQSLWWNGEEVEGTMIENLPAGEVHFEVLDSIGCAQALSTVLLDGTEITSTPPLFVANCNGNYDFVFSGVQNGGNGELSVDWNGIDTNDVAPGSYSYVVSDSLNCQTLFPLELEDFSPLEVISTFNGIQDEGGGSIELDIQGGFEPYSVIWSNGATSESISNLNPGSYEVSVVDAMGCGYSESFLITSTQEFQQEKLLVYPNPGHHELKLLNTTPGLLTVIDAQGKQVYSIRIYGSSLSISTENWGAGMYFIHLQSKERKQVLPWIKSN